MKKIIFIISIIVSISLTITAYASSATITVPTSGMDAYANANITYNQGTVSDLVDFVGCGARIGGSADEAVNEDNAARIRISGDKTGQFLYKLFWYNHALNCQKGIKRSNRSLTATVWFEENTSTRVLK